MRSQTTIVQTPIAETVAKVIIPQPTKIERKAIYRNLGEYVFFKLISGLSSEANILLAMVNGIALDSLIQENCLNPKQQKMAIRRYFDGITI